MKRAAVRVFAASALRVFAASILCAASAAAARAHPATGVVVDSERRVVYFSDLETIWKIDAAGRASEFRAGVRGRHVHELSIDAAGNVYGGDISYEGGRWFSAFWKMSPAGEISYLLPRTEGFAPGWGVQRDAAGNSYRVEQNNHEKRETLLLRRAPDGRVVNVAGGAYGHADGRGRQARFGSVGGLAVAADGTAYLTDGQSLRRVTPDGAVSTIAHDLGAKDPETRLPVSTTLSGLSGLAPDGRGNVYVADNGNRRVLRVGGDGAIKAVARAEYPWSPTGVAVASDGAVYVLEVGFTLTAGLTGSRVRRIAPDGGVLTLATVGAQGAADGGRGTTPQRAVAQVERLAASDRGARLYLAVALTSLGALTLARFISRRRQT